MTWNKMAAPIAFTQWFYYQEKHLVMSKSTGSSLFLLLQSTVALIVFRNYSILADRKWSKYWSSAFFLLIQPSTITWEVTWLKQPSIMRKFPRMVLLCLVWNETIGLHWVFPTTVDAISCCCPCNNAVIHRGCVGETFMQGMKCRRFLKEI